MDGKVNITFVTSDGRKIEMTSRNVPRVGDTVELLTGAKPNKKECWAVSQCTWDYWLSHITIQVTK
jgi:hypothetical protein